MEVQIKRAVKAGNSSAVILPRAWLNQEVRIELVEKNKEKILFETLEIAKKYMGLDRIIGVYLAGSYARGEETKESDIDILVITDSVDKEMIYEGSYNILIISKELLSQKLKEDLFPIGQMIKEAKALINSNYLSSIKVKVTKENTKWYLNTTEEKLKLIKLALENTKNNTIDNKVIYTLILRIRTLHIIDKLINNKEYSKKEFLKLISKISGKNAYNSYLSIKNNLTEANKTTKEEAEKLYSYLKKQLDDVKKMLK